MYLTIRKQLVIGLAITTGLLGSSAAFADPANPGAAAGNGQSAVAAPSTGNAQTPPASPNSPAVEIAPSIPYIASATRTGAADIQLRSTLPAIDTVLLGKGADTAGSITAPITLYVERMRNSAATQYVYAITRDGQVVVSSEKPLSIVQSRILLRHRTEETAGLRSGAVTLWVWGVDQFGHISSPVKARFIIAGQD